MRAFIDKSAFRIRAIDSSWSFKSHVDIKCRVAFARLHLLYLFWHILSTSQNFPCIPIVISLFDYADVVYTLLTPALNQHC